MEVENYTKRKETKIGDLPFPTSMIMRGRVFPSSHVLFEISGKAQQNTGQVDADAFQETEKTKHSVENQEKQLSKAQQAGQYQSHHPKEFTKVTHFFSAHFFSLKKHLIFKDTLKKSIPHGVESESLLPNHHFWGPW